MENNSDKTLLQQFQIKESQTFFFFFFFIQETLAKANKEKTKMPTVSENSLKE